MAKGRPPITGAESAIMASIERASDQADVPADDQADNPEPTASDDQPTEDQTEVVEAEEIVRAPQVIDAEVIDSGATFSEIAKRDREPGAVELYKLPAMRVLVSHLEAHASTGNDVDLAIDEIVAQVLSADSLREILADTSAIGLLELLNVPIRIHAVKYQRSEFEKGSPWYALMDVERGDNGWRGAVSTGAQTVLAQLARFQQLSLFPVTVKAIRATKKPTAAGYWPIRLAEVE